MCTISDALAGDGGVGRERVTVAPGSVAFENNGKMGVPAEVSSVEPVRGCGAVDGDRAIFLPCVAVSAGEARFSGVAAIEAWLSARATVAGSVLSCGTANLDHLASVGSSLLRVAAVLLRLPRRLVLQF